MEFVIFLTIIFIFSLPFLLREKPLFMAILNFALLVYYIFTLFNGSGEIFHNHILLIVIVPWILGNFFKKNIEQLDTM